MSILSEFGKIWCVPRFGIVFFLSILFLIFGRIQAENSRHSLIGEVMRLNPERMTIVVKHNSVGDILQSGKTTFSVSPGDLAWLQEGRLIQAEGLVAGNGYRLECIWPARVETLETMAAINRELRQDTVARGRGVFRSVGEFLPPFALYNQNGELVQNKTIMGRFTIINFIFTRCRNPKMCPASTARMQKLQDSIKARGISNAQLLSISFDPEYDTPGVLRQYADSHEIDGRNFFFLTGPKSAINDLLKQTGIITVQADGTIDHSMATLLVDDKGKIIYRKEGSSWQVEDFLDRLIVLTVDTKADPNLTSVSLDD